ncbi:hypothetical protein KFE98_19585 [bacterium SCSIO 12741]|nr:hypothetical protein KFE98_19585 [bacterium SCSIO 12741]
MKSILLFIIFQSWCIQPSNNVFESEVIDNYWLSCNIDNEDKQDSLSILVYFNSENVEYTVFSGGKSEKVIYDYDDLIVQKNYFRLRLKKDKKRKMTGGYMFGLLDGGGFGFMY